MSTATILLDTFNETRSLSHHYFNKLKDTDINKTFDANGVPLNSAKWIMAHLAWGEHFLILEAMGGEKIPVEWFSKVAFGSPMTDPSSLPDIEEILSTLKTVHETANNFVRPLTDEFLEEKNVSGLRFGPNESKRYMLMHAIRHEGTHAGHLGWLCKINGIKTS
ncbi:MAG: hypothetical protein JWN78_2559 [Bacteroidota bacterium]|nr:hypothetical protein [Bacteroidota bacterium]